MYQYRIHEAYSQDIENEIMSWLDYDSIYIQCKKDKYLKENYFNNEKFWILKAKLDFNISPDIFKYTFLSPHERYLQLLSYKNHVALKSYQFIDIKKFIKLAITTKKDYLLDDPNIKLYQELYNKIIYYFIKIDDIKNVQKWIQFLTIKRNFNTFYPVRTLKMLKTLEFYIHNYTQILIKNPKMIKYGDMELLKHLFENSTNLDIKYLQMLLNTPNREKFYFMITKINIQSTDLNYTLAVVYSTADHDYINFVFDYFTKNGINGIINLYTLFENICISKNFIFFAPIFDKIKSGIPNMLNHIEFVSKNTNIQILTTILEYTNTRDYEIVYQIISDSSFRHDVKETIEYVINKYGNNYISLYNIEQLISRLDIHEVIDLLSVLDKYKYYLPLNLTYSFMTAMKIKDKQYIDIIYDYLIKIYNKYRYLALDMYVIENKYLLINDTRLKNYIDKLKYFNLNKIY